MKAVGITQILEMRAREPMATHLQAADRGSSVGHHQNWDRQCPQLSCQWHPPASPAQPGRALGTKLIVTSSKYETMRNTCQS